MELNTTHKLLIGTFQPYFLLDLEQVSQQDLATFDHEQCKAADNCDGLQHCILDMFFYYLQYVISNNFDKLQWKTQFFKN